MNRPVVIKVGGSLFGWNELPTRLGSYLAGRRGTPLVLLPGGGPVVDLVRDLDALHALGDDAAHALAVGALDFTARLLASLLETLEVVEDLPSLAPVWQAGRIPVLAPRRFLEQEDRAADHPLPHSWSVTSDSIAARLAEVLDASELVLLKSVALPAATSRTEAALLGLVDSAFPGVARKLTRVVYLNLRDPSAVPQPV